MRHISAKLHKGLSIGIALSIFVQMFLAGLWHADVAPVEFHIFFGLAILLASLILLILALTGRMGRKIILPTLVLFILVLLQPILIEQRRVGIPFLSAFHTLNAAFVGATAGAVAAISRRYTPAETGVEPQLAPQAGD